MRVCRQKEKLTARNKPRINVWLFGDGENTTWRFYYSMVISSHVFVFADLTITEQQIMSEYTQIIYCLQMRDLPQVSKH